jgi:hypothetical protein
MLDAASTSAKKGARERAPTVEDRRSAVGTEVRERVFLNTEVTENAKVGAGAEREERKADPSLHSV